MKIRILEELTDFYRFFWRTPESEKQIIVYVENGSYRAYLDGIIEKLTGEYGQNICYVTSDARDSTRITPGRGIRPFYSNTLLSIFMQMVRSKVFIMTLTDLNQFHLKRSAYPVHYVYVFHTMVSTHMVFRAGAYDHYDSILCAGPHHVREIRKRESLHQLPPKRLVEVGYYRLERIYAAYQQFSKREKAGKPVVLLAPSWGKDNIIESCGSALIELLLAQGYVVIVRPHPETAKRSPHIIRTIEDRFSSHADFTLERSVGTDESLLMADVLISDYSGVALEYAFGTERPVLYIDVPKKIHNPDYKEIGLEPAELSLRPHLGLTVSPDNLASVPELVSRLIAERDTYKQTIRDLRAEYVFSFGRSSEVSARYIMNTVQSAGQ